MVYQKGRQNHVHLGTGMHEASSYFTQGHMSSYPLMNGIDFPHFYTVTISNESYIIFLIQWYAACLITLVGVARFGNDLSDLSNLALEQFMYNKKPFQAFCISTTRPLSVSYTIIESTIKVKADCYWKNMVFGLVCLWDKSNEYRRRNGGEDSTESQETISSWVNGAPQSSLKCWKQWNWSSHEINNYLLGWCCAVLLEAGISCYIWLLLLYLQYQTLTCAIVNALFAAPALHL